MSAILIVDDEATATRILRLQLEKAGYEVETACNGEVALELFREREFDVLVTDVNMPRMDGHELCQALRRELPDRDPLIFILTGRPGEGHRRKAANVVNVEFIEKPASLRHLIARIGERLEELRQKQEASS